MDHLAYQLARVIVWLRIVALASRWPFRPCIGDLVKHDGRVWTLTQGVRDPIWTLRGPGEPREVHRDDFTKIKTLRNLIGSFRSGYRFYDGYWREIWVSELNRFMRVKGRMMGDPKCTLTDGSPVTPDHREIDPAVGGQYDALNRGIIADLAPVNGQPHSYARGAVLEAVDTITALRAFHDRAIAILGAHGALDQGVEVDALTWLAEALAQDERLRARVAELERDRRDTLNSPCVIWRRCPCCKRLHADGLICPGDCSEEAINDARAALDRAREGE